MRLVNFFFFNGGGERTEQKVRMIEPSVPKIGNVNFATGTWRTLRVLHSITSCLLSSADRATVRREQASRRPGCSPGRNYGQLAGRSFAFHGFAANHAPLASYPLAAAAAVDPLSPPPPPPSCSQAVPSSPLTNRPKPLKSSVAGPSSSPTTASPPPTRRAPRHRSLPP